MPATSKEVLGVPELGLDLSVNIKLLENCLSFILSLAVGESSHICQVLARVKNEEEVVRRIVRVHGGVVLDKGVLTAHIGAPVAIRVLPEHLADAVLIPQLIAGNGFVVADGDTSLTLNPKAGEVLVLGARLNSAGFKSANLVGDEEVELCHVLDGP